MKVLITGSSSGIGKAIAKKLLTETHQVIGLARNHQKFIPDNPNYFPHQIDFSKIDTLEDQLKMLAKENTDIDAIICNAGMGHFCELEQFSLAKMQELMQVNFISQALLIKIFIANIKKQSQGKIIFIGSEAALQGAKKSTIYSASKFALRGFAQSLRSECNSNNIAVTVINPGMVKTPFFDQLNFNPGKADENTITPEQIAQTISLLLQLKNNCVIEEINLQPLKKVVIKNYITSI